MAFTTQRCGTLLSVCLWLCSLLLGAFAITFWSIISSSRSEQLDDYEWKGPKTTYRVDTNWIVTPYVRESAKQNDVADSLLKSWKAEPFSDVVVLDLRSGSTYSCPETHPLDVVFDVWPGTRHVCDCLERVERRAYYTDMECDKTDNHNSKGKRAPHQSDDCKDVKAIPPIIQSSINGMRVCGKPAKGLNLANATRPEQDVLTGKYFCPTGFKACQESWLSSPVDVEKVICIQNGKDTEADCPITAFAFTLE